MKRICDHCDRHTRGFVDSIYRNDDSGERACLCHPGEGMDCYFLVTKMRHPTPCPTCRDANEATAPAGPCPA